MRLPNLLSCQCSSMCSCVMSLSSVVYSFLYKTEQTRHIKHGSGQITNTITMSKTSLYMCISNSAMTPTNLYIQIHKYKEQTCAQLKTLFRKKHSHPFHFHNLLMSSSHLTLVVSTCNFSKAHIYVFNLCICLYKLFQYIFISYIIILTSSNVCIFPRIPWLYHNVHHIHHQNRDPFALAAQDSSISELLSLQTLAFISAMLVGCHPFSEILFHLVNTWMAVEDHCGYDFPWALHRLLPCFGGAPHHLAHHQHFKGNFAPYFRHWDYIFGTTLPISVKKRDHRQGESRLIGLLQDSENETIKSVPLSLISPYMNSHIITQFLQR